MVSKTSALIDLLRHIERRSWTYDAYVSYQRRIAGYTCNPQQALPPDDWQEFKRKFIKEYGGETVRADGLTHSEFIEYLRSGQREYEWDDQ